MKNGIFLLLGTNQGDPFKNLLIARENVEICLGKILKASSLYKTAAWGNVNQEPFLNQVLQINTTLPPETVLQKILEIESEMGRNRTEKWGPRIIDIDLLFYDQLIIETHSLQLPHPEIPNRRFTLVPLAEIAPGFFHPKLKKQIVDILHECTDTLPVELLE